MGQAGSRLAAAGIDAKAHLLRRLPPQPVNQHVVMMGSAFPSFPHSRFYGGAKSLILAATSTVGSRLLPRDGVLRGGPGHGAWREPLSSDCGRRHAKERDWAPVIYAPNYAYRARFTNV